jgi:hypothetical protein
VTANVTTAIASIEPLPAWAAEWWAADNVPIDSPVTVRVSADVASGDEAESGFAPRGGRYLSIFGDLLSTTWRFLLNVA